MKAILSILTCTLLSAGIGYFAFVNNHVDFNAFVGTTLIQLLGTIFAINIGIIPVLYYDTDNFAIDFVGVLEGGIGRFV